MRVENEIDALRRRLDELAAVDDDDLERYELRHPRMPPGLYWKVRWLGGRILRALEALGLKKPDPWPAGLKRWPGSERDRPLLVWAVGTDRDTLREACRALAGLRDALPDLAPVIVTDVADFAFFSRLGWLIEYLPRISGEGEPYDSRKAKFLARLYRGAPALPVGALLESRSGDELRRRLAKGC